MENIYTITANKTYQADKVLGIFDYIGNHRVTLEEEAAVAAETFKKIIRQEFEIQKIDGVWWSHRPFKSNLFARFQSISGEIIIAPFDCSFDEAKEKQKSIRLARVKELRAKANPARKFLYLSNNIPAYVLKRGAKAILKGIDKIPKLGDGELLGLFKGLITRDCPIKYDTYHSKPLSKEQFYKFRQAVINEAETRGAVIPDTIIAGNIREIPNYREGWRENSFIEVKEGALILSYYRIVPFLPLQAALGGTEKRFEVPFAPRSSLEARVVDGIKFIEANRTKISAGEALRRLGGL